MNIAVFDVEVTSEITVVFVNCKAVNRQLLLNSELHAIRNEFTSHGK